MSSKAFASAQKGFAEESEKAFRFLVTDFGFAGPERTDAVLQEVSYARDPRDQRRVSAKHASVRMIPRL
jgi:hypothetical protein